ANLNRKHNSRPHNATAYRKWHRRSLTLRRIKLRCNQESCAALKGRSQEMNRITHFEIYTENPQTVQPFYQDVFGWKFNKFEGGPVEYWLVTTGDDKEPGINGGMTRPPEGQSPGTLKTVAVKSLDQTIKKIETRGGTNFVPKEAIPKDGRL